MRSTIALCFVLLAACSKSESAGAEEARKEAERIQKEKEKTGGAAKVMRPPVAGEAKIPCTQLLDAAALTTTLGEKDPLVMKDVTKAETGATSSCSLVRGGKKLSEAEQKAIRKNEARLGVLPGDELCNISAFCSTIEDPDKFKQRCADKKDKADESMGNFACVHINAQGVDDQPSFRFYDADTKCILQARGGPSNVNEESIRKCATAARDMIGPAQIAVDPASGTAEQGSGG
jgi:hypothetical protein